MVEKNSEKYRKVPVQFGLVAILEDSYTVPLQVVDIRLIERGQRKIVIIIFLLLQSK